MSAEETDVFLTHDWGKDEMGRNNHDRVSVVNESLKAMGYTTWFDTDRMTGNIVDKMCSGIDNTKIILVFVTERYCKKVGGTDSNDNCKMEFMYAQRRKGAASMIPIVMESRMETPSKWDGALGMALGGELAIRMPFDIDKDPDKFADTLEDLKSEIDVRLEKLQAPDPEPCVVPAETVVSPQDTGGAEWEDIIYSLKQGRADRIRIRKFGVCGDGKYLTVDKSADTITLTEDRLEASVWCVTPWRQNGKIGYAIFSAIEHSGKGHQPLVTRTNSKEVYLAPHSVRADLQNFWAILPITSDEYIDMSKYPFKIMKLGGRKMGGFLTTHWAELTVTEHFTVICSTANNNNMWELVEVPEVKSFGEILYKNIARWESDVTFRTTSNKTSYLCAGEDLGNNKTAVSLVLNGNTQKQGRWRIISWRQDGRHCVVINNLANSKCLVDDGEEIILRDSVCEVKEAVTKCWELIPTGKFSFRIRKVGGKNDGSYLYFKKNGNDILVCIKLPAEVDLNEYNWILGD